MRVDHTKYPRVDCCCEDCAEMRKTCTHPHWRGKTQFCHDSYATWAYDYCTRCGESRNMVEI